MPKSILKATRKVKEKKTNARNSAFSGLRATNPNSASEVSAYAKAKKSQDAWCKKQKAKGKSCF